ncbi:hypothetical protein [Pilimelia terevasa]|nr:hypothetical protein [Pilimelia terevasa]
MVLLGAAHLRHLLPEAASVDLSRLEDRDGLNALADQCVEAAGAHAKQRRGTHLHHLSEHVDCGEPLPTCTGADLADMGAYKLATVALNFTTIEQLVVVDALKVAGTPDRIAHYSGPGPAGKAVEGNFIADLKTGSVEYGVLKMAMQLAVYAHGQFYDPATGQRSPLPDVRRDWGLIIHLPAGTGECTVYWIDLRLGWEAVQVATQVRAIRARRFRLKPLGAGSNCVLNDLVDPGHGL